MARGDGDAARSNCCLAASISATFCADEKLFNISSRNAAVTTVQLVAIPDRLSALHSGVVRHGWPAHARRLLALLLVAATLAIAQTVSLPDPMLLARMREYIAMSWDTLSRSNRDLLKALPDPKMPRQPGEPWP